MLKLVGIDGCRSGWIAVSLSDRCALLFERLSDLVAHYDEDALFLIDMPIGLPDKMIGRSCETDARKELSSQRKSSIFPIPCREAVYAETYEMANRINRRILQKGISKQTWFICSKIKELDYLLLQDKKLQMRIKESHPEVAFHYLNHRVSMEFSKKTEAGQQERLFLLSNFSQNINVIYINAIQKFNRRDVAKDDIIDALCLAVTLEEIIRNNISLESPSKDDKNIDMKMHFFDSQLFKSS